MIPPLLLLSSALLAFTGTSLSSPLSNNILTLPSFNQSDLLTFNQSDLLTVNQSDLSAFNASAFNLSADFFNRFPVPGTPVTLDLFGYEEDIPRGRFYAMLTAAALLIQPAAERYPTRAITSGSWLYEHRTQDGASCIFKVHDFSGIGKPLTYSRLVDVLTGLIAFSYEKDIYKTLDFLVDIKLVGLVAGGYIRYTTPPSTAAVVDVA